MRAGQKHGETHLVSADERRLGGDGPVAARSVQVCVAHARTLELDEALARLEVRGLRDGVVVDELQGRARRGHDRSALRARNRDPRERRHRAPAGQGGPVRRGEDGGQLDAVGTRVGRGARGERVQPLLRVGAHCAAYRSQQRHVGDLGVRWRGGL